MVVEIETDLWRFVETDKKRIGWYIIDDHKCEKEKRYEQEEGTVDLRTWWKNIVCDR